MSIETTTKPANTGSDFDDLAHLNCPRCNPDIGPGQKSYCGKDLIGVWRDASDLCIVCAELANYPCPRCRV